MDKIVIDLETTGLNPYKDKIIGVAWKLNPGEAHYKEWDEVDKKKLQDTLLTHECIFHNAKFDLQFLRSAGFQLPKIFHDTMVLSFLYDENNSNSLEKSCQKYCYIKPWKQELKYYLKDKKLKESDYDKVPLEIITHYAKQDAANTFILFNALYPEIMASGMGELYQQELELVKVLLDVERRGIPIDNNFLLSMDKTLEIQRQEIAQQIYRLAGEEFNIASTDELSKILYGKLKLPVLEMSPKTRKPSTSIYAIERLKHPIIPLILEYRNLTKLQNTYCKSIADKTVGQDNLLRCKFNQLGARTGRFSSSDPNLQNIPKSHLIKQAFICRPDYYNFYFDYKQMEINIYAHFSYDPNIREALISNKDVHLEMAKKFYNTDTINEQQRNRIKTLNFAIVYGIGIAGVMRQFNMTRQQAIKTLDTYKSTFPILEEFNQHIKEQIETYGHIINPFGRIRRLPVGEAYKAVNSLVQGTCSDIMKQAMIKIHTLLDGKKSNIILTIHDEIVVEIHKDELDLVEPIKDIMEDFKQFEPPLKVEVKYTKTNWYEKELK